jgi:putative phosphonate metabolism protein
MTARYALYYAPAADDPLMVAASSWLGRDPFSGEARTRPWDAGLAGLDLDALTDDPRHYGFHATLKAPFELAEGETETSLAAALEAYCRTRQPFSVTLEIRALGPFLAFMLAEPSTGMQTLHEDSVRLFDRFRAPISEFDFKRRLRPGMTARQETQLREFGYPGIFEDFRFHMTLTGAIKDEAVRARVFNALKVRFASLEGAHKVAGLGVFMQTDRDSDFTVLGRYAFGA